MIIGQRKKLTREVGTEVPKLNVRNDQFSGLKSAEYLYGEGKKIIDKSTTSAICLFKIVNLPEINEEIGNI